MPEVDFFYVKTDIFDDEKIRIIENLPDADALIVLWVKLLAQAAKCNADGWIWLKENKPFSDEMLAQIFNRPVNTIRLALKVFQEMEMIHRNGTGIFVINWTKIQNTNALARIRETTRARVQRLRDRQKLLPPPLGNVTSNVTVTPIRIHDTDTDTRYIDTDKSCTVTLQQEINDETVLPFGQSVGKLKRILLKENKAEFSGITSVRKRFFYLELKRLGVPIDELMKEGGIEIDFPVKFDDNLDEVK